MATIQSAASGNWSSLGTWAAPTALLNTTFAESTINAAFGSLTWTNTVTTNLLTNVGRTDSRCISWANGSASQTQEISGFTTTGNTTFSFWLWCSWYIGNPIYVHYWNGSAWVK